jgi:hypothetical protein
MRFARHEKRRALILLLIAVVVIALAVWSLTPHGY